MTKLPSLLAAAALVAAPALPQGHECPMQRAAASEAATPAPTQTASASPYAGQQERRLKALSDEEVQGYLDGRGAGLARPAVSHYPGPRHVLDLAAELSLSGEQRVQTRATFERMHAEAVERGARLVQSERDLEDFFAQGGADPARLQALVEAAARAQGELRDTHLRAHLEMRRILTPEQVARYDALRGYGSGAQHAGSPAHVH